MKLTSDVCEYQPQPEESGGGMVDDFNTIATQIHNQFIKSFRIRGKGRRRASQRRTPESALGTLVRKPRIFIRKPGLAPDFGNFYADAGYGTLFARGHIHPGSAQISFWCSNLRTRELALASSGGQFLSGTGEGLNGWGFLPNF